MNEKKTCGVQFVIIKVVKLFSLHSHTSLLSNKSLPIQKKNMFHQIYFKLTWGPMGNKYISNISKWQYKIYLGNIYL